MYYSSFPPIPSLPDGDFIPVNSQYFGIQRSAPGSNVWVRSGPPPAPAPPALAQASNSNGSQASQSQVPTWVLLVGGIGLLWWLSSK